MGNRGLAIHWSEVVYLFTEEFGQAGLFLAYILDNLLIDPWVDLTLEECVRQLGPFNIVAEQGFLFRRDTVDQLLDPSVLLLRDLQRIVAGESHVERFR
jgi:hypothetical protein